MLSTTTFPELPASTPIKKQEKVTDWKTYKEDGDSYRIRVFLEYDDSCNNGYNSFSITGETQYLTRNNRWVDDSGGCIHDKIAEHFPEYSHLIKWHLTSSSKGPWNYFSAHYYTTERDYNGLLKGEIKQKRSRFTGNLPMWQLTIVDTTTGNEVTLSRNEITLNETKPQPPSYTFEYKPVYIVGEGKERDLDAARRCAVWPDATDEELLVSSEEELNAILLARLPSLMLEFKKDMEALGFTY